LNGELINAPRKLRERDRIRIGWTVFGFLLQDEGEKKLEKSLYDIATRDSLTDLDNRSQFIGYVKHHVHLFRRHGNALSILLVGIDHLKAINDDFGRDIGDEVIVHVARTVVQHCRSTELCARLAPDTIAVLLPGSDPRAVVTLADRIETGIRTTGFRVGSKNLEIKLQMAGTQARQEDSGESLLQRAENLLVRARQRGTRIISADNLSESSVETVVFQKKQE
jgi:diguanylate cyclase (GGDEF)-like protein